MFISMCPIEDATSGVVEECLPSEISWLIPTWAIHAPALWSRESFIISIFLIKILVTSFKQNSWDFSKSLPLSLTRTFLMAARVLISPN